MDNIQFYKSFYFCSHLFRKRHHTDNSEGTVCNHIGWIHAGEATFDVGGEIHTFSEGDVFYTPPGCCYHSYWSGETISYDSFAFSLFPDRSGADYSVQKFELTAAAREHLAALAADKKVSAASVARLYAFLGEVLPTMTPTARDPKREAVTAAREYMRSHLDFSVRDLARHLGISESGVYALFRETLHRTPIEEKNRIRVERAAQLLTTTDLSVESVAETLGFSSAAYFRKVLYAVKGVTPREIRKKLTKEL